MTHVNIDKFTSTTKQYIIKTTTTTKQCNELTSGAIQGKVPTRDIFVVLANSRDVPKSQIYAIHAHTMHALCFSSFYNTENETKINKLRCIITEMTVTSGSGRI